MASAVDSRLAYARLSAVAMASRLPTANRGSTNSYTTSWDTTRHGRTLADFSGARATVQTLKRDRRHIATAFNFLLAGFHTNIDRIYPASKGPSTHDNANPLLTCADSPAWSNGILLP